MRSPAIVLISFCCICLNACTGKNGDRHDLIHYKVQPSKGVSVLASEMVHDVSYIPLINPKGIYFGASDRIKQVGGDYYILDSEKSKTVTAYDRSGRFKWQLDKERDGPEDYKDIAKIALSRFTSGEASGYCISAMKMMKLGC
ncbi:hypothetical protein DN752_03880 [Echinicola strongylocentroti]|uniref:6-bladed beta-propeller n=1 Tax=Echinicola strongylocentroti TaxID=1795355 RepID=A0A2Z4IE53_9BACT|nr:6-bladed beta-propeller [Echinicola strongylocentroti]AWW29351.1 hypothetical protein DN752_03880 [Echinicola strongylocentroti]